jgi:hypothetical protein
MNMVEAHTTGVSALAFNNLGDRLATASSKVQATPASIPPSFSPVPSLSSREDCVGKGFQCLLLCAGHRVPGVCHPFGHQAV